MEIKKYKIGENEYEFVCESWSTYRAWGHKVTLFINNVNVSENKARYYNRTWECFCYQTCMLGALKNQMNSLLEYKLNKYKYDNKIERFKKGEKDRVINEIKELAEYKEYEKLYENIYGGNRNGGIIE